MNKTGDHALDPFEKRHDPEALEDYVKAKQTEANARRGKNRMGNETAEPKGKAVLPASR